MARDVCVVIVHGINTERPGYSDGYQKKLLRALPKALRGHVTCREVFWAEHLRDRQKTYVERADSVASLKRTRIRGMALQALGDAAAYQKTQWVRNSSYYTVQKCVLDKLAELETMGDPRPLILVGHSLGCHVISTLAWDIHSIKLMSQEQINQAADEDWRRFASDICGASPMQRLDTLAGIVTFGNNMPLFTFTFGPERVFPITHSRSADAAPAFPGPSLSPDLAAAARWVNIYSPNDPLGYPLKCLNQAYEEEARLTDIPVRVEGIIPNPYDAHVKYWTNGRVVKESAKLVREIIEA